MHNVAYLSSIFKRINYHQTEGISYTDTEWVFHPMSEVHTAYFFDKPIYRYLVARNGQTCDPSVRCKHLDQEVTVLMKLLNILKTIPKNNLAYSYMERVVDYRVWSIYGMGLAKESTLNLNEFDAQLSAYPEAYKRASNLTLSVGLFGLKFRYVKAWRKVRSRKKLFLFPLYDLFVLMCHIKPQTV